MAEWITVARTDDLPEGEMIGATVGELEVLVANVDGRYCAIGSVCTHGDARWPMEICTAAP